MKYVYTVTFEVYTRKENENLWKLKESTLTDVVSSYKKVTEILKLNNVTILEDGKWTFRMFPFETYSYKTTEEGIDIKYIYEIKQWEL